jgi:outer membrane protein OmpA-like peptidoglycan-associated protein
MGYRVAGFFGAVAVAGLMASGCATEKYVDDRVAELSSKIDGVSSQVAQVSSKVDQVGGRVEQVNAKVDAANGRIEQVNASTQAAGKRADDAYKLAQGSLTRTVLAEDDSITFDTNKWALSEEAQAKLTSMAQQLKAQNKNVFLEIVGNGDPRGSTMNNRVLGEKRALEVRRFLSSQGIPLSHMETVSWGEERLKNPERSDTAHEENRRVLIRTLG